MKSFQVGSDHWIMFSNALMRALELKLSLRGLRFNTPEEARDFFRTD